MRTGVTVHLSPSDRKRLQTIVDDRNSPQKHVWRARIVLATANGLGTMEIMRAAGVSKTAVWRWQARFMEAGVEGLLRDKTRPSPGRCQLSWGGPRSALPNRTGHAAAAAAAHVARASARNWRRIGRRIRWGWVLKQL